MIGYFGRDHAIELVNREWERTLGWSLEEVTTLGTEIFALAYPDPAQRERAVDFVMTSSGEWADFTTTTKDGRVIDSSWAMIRLSDGTSVGIGMDITARKQRLQTLSSQLMAAHEEERRAVARELHDQIGQALTAVGANLRALELASDPATPDDRLRESVHLVDEALQQVRDLALELRPSLLDDFGLVPALDWLVRRQAERSGFAAAFIPDEIELHVQPSLATTCFRVAQLALTNVASHARAKQVCVELRLKSAELELVIRDDGVGFDVDAALARSARGATLGLASMQERVRLASGVVAITSTPEHGTEICARFPLPADDGLERDP